MFVRNCWYVAGWSQEFGERDLSVRVIANRPILLYRKLDGTLVAMDNRCVHRNASLALGCLEGDEVRCMYHGFKYAADGKCVEIPGQTSVPSAARVQSYPVHEKYGWAWIWLGEHEKASTELIPGIRELDAREWRLRTGSLDYEASYELVNDNLTDLSHLSFVHKDSFRAGRHWVDIQPTVTPLSNGVRVQRWVTDPASDFQGSAAGESIDQYIEYDHLVPGIFLLHSITYPAGTIAAKARGEALPAPIFETYTRQAVTPMTAKTTRYAFSWGPPVQGGTEESADVMFKVAQMAFAEDRKVIEAQQKMLDLEPDRPVMATRMDIATVTFSRLMKKLENADNCATDRT